VDRLATVSYSLVLSLLIAWMTAPLGAEVDTPARVWRVGVLWFTSPAVSAPFAEALRQGLRDRGYREGQNVVIEQRYAERDPSRYYDLVSELIRMPVDVIVAGNLESGRVAKEGTSTVPIVLTAGGDPVRAGLVQSLSRPGANVTGMSEIVPDLAPKLLQLLREIVPRLSHLAIMWDPENPSHTDTRDEMRKTADVLGIRLLSVPVTRPPDVERAYTSLAHGRPDGLVVYVTPITQAHRRRIVDFAGKRRLPAMYSAREFVEDGGLMSYGPNHRDLFRRAAGHIDRILKGAQPADLPIEQPTKFELIINLKTAKALGLTIPQSLLLRADQVIE